MKIEPYLFFEGRCDEAIAFDRDALGAELLMRMTYADSPDPVPAECAPAHPGQVMHAALRIGETVVGMSDGFGGGAPRFEGIALSLTADDDASARRWFDALADGGAVKAPFGPTFFASAFGMVADRFGVAWMILNPRPR